MRFQDLYRGYTKNHGSSKSKGTTNDKGKAEYSHFTKSGPPTEEEWNQHLSGKGNGLGIIPLMDDNHSVCWGAIDIDVYPLDHALLEEKCKEKKLPLVITKSKSGGAHLWLYLKEPTPAHLVINRLAEWAAAIGYGGCEVFPKQHKRVVENDTGNWINLPYYGNTRVCFCDGKECTFEEFLEIAERFSITQDLLQKVTFLSDTSDGSDFADGPPCLQYLAKNGIAEGGRNNAMFNVGMYFKLKDPETFKERTHEWNKKNIDPCLGESEVNDSLKTLERKEYNFTCSKHPINGHCNRPLCVKREFGIAKGSKNDELNVTISGLTKLDTSEPVWSINIDGVRTNLPGTECLLSQPQFGKICVERVHKILKPIAVAKWNELMQGLLDKVEIIEAPPEASPEGQFFAHLMNYVEIRRADNRDAVAAGNVWVCDECKKAYFRSTDFFQYLRREGFRDLKNNRMFELLHCRGLAKGRWNIKGQTVAYWSVPVEGLQTESFDAPSFTDGMGEKQ